MPRMPPKSTTVTTDAAMPAPSPSSVLFGLAAMSGVLPIRDPAR